MKFPGNDCVLDLEHPAALSSRLGGGENLEVQDLHGEQFNLFLSDPSPIIGYACHSLTH